jgi:hypothetical protein
MTKAAYEEVAKSITSINMTSVIAYERQLFKIPLRIMEPYIAKDRRSAPPLIRASITLLTKTGKGH